MTRSEPRSLEAAHDQRNAAITAAYRAIDAAPPAEAEIKAAIALPEANGYSVRRRKCP